MRELLHLRLDLCENHGRKLASAAPAFKLGFAPGVRPSPKRLWCQLSAFRSSNLKATGSTDAPPAVSLRNQTHRNRLRWQSIGPAREGRGPL
jgi:hypothetical protein